MQKYKFVLLILFSLTFFCELYSQTENHDFIELKTAYHNFLQKNYIDAYSYYKKMLDVYPKDPGYNYYTGVCLLNIEKNPESALEHLQYAAENDITNEVYFYLGIAYLRNYQFDEALDNFKEFEENASPKQKYELELDNYLSKALNGIYLVKYARIPSVYDKIQSTEDKFYKEYDTHDLGGKFKNIKTSFHINDSITENTIVFIPVSADSEEVLYYSAKNNERGDYDIYRIVRYSDSLYGEPENLGNVINTPFDENYPFLHSDGATLYFASKGHYSMGGYDLYKSTWSWEYQEWTEPVNLDYPINSPYYDILFVPSPDKKTAFFATDRDYNNSGYTVYKIKLNYSKPFIEVENHKSILKYAYPEVDVESFENRQKEEYKSSGSEIVKLQEQEKLLHKTEYDSLLKRAASFQFSADSLQWILDDKRSELDNVGNEQKKNDLTNSIINLEKEIYQIQKEADKCYNNVRQIEQLNLADNKTIYENTHKTKQKTKESIPKEKNYIEPVDTSIRKSILKPAKVFVDSSKLVRNKTGLRVKQPSAYNEQNPIPVNKVLPDRVIYMIQLGAFSSEKPPRVFKGLEPLYCLHKEGSTIRKYLAGHFLKLSNAEGKILDVKRLGFKDAYIVAFFKGRIIPVKEAVKMESKKIELITSDVNNTESKIFSGELDLSISYIVKVEINKADTLFFDKLNKLISTEKEITIEEKDSNNVYYIKTFTRFEDADKVKKKTEVITNNNIEIQALFAKIKMPLEQARKITK
ncbi:MAG: PD40 domain-containing protein [Bacteroidales bacterium]|nr:PD40 domain-containing protein [Bacteroidales bacterium]